MSHLLETKIEFLKGVGPRRAVLLNKELQVYTFEDLLNVFPFRYVDKSQIHKINDVRDETIYYQLVGTISNMQVHGSPRATRITATFTDVSGAIEICWFRGLKWIKNQFRPGVKYILFGKASVFNNKLNFIHPDIEEYNPQDVVMGESLQGVYNTTEAMKNNGLGTKQLAKLIKTLVPQVYNVVPEILPNEILQKERLISRSRAYYQIHLPADSAEIQQAVRRLKYEEHFFFQLRLFHNKRRREQQSRGSVFSKVGTLFNLFYDKYLPFPLTTAQKRVIREIHADMKSGHQMNRLLQGDVGSGKTIVALLVMLLALDNNFQAAFMAPTEILAMQHYQTFKELLKDMPVTFALLIGSTKASERKSIYNDLAEGTLQIVIGTHAIIEDKVVFKNLALTIIDEQHRFGVAQRARFWDKTAIPPHTLVMTATPIPRTLAMTQYGDLDVSVINELPPGRKPIQTKHFYHEDRLKILAFMRKQIALGRQIYVVYPLIKESEKLDLINLQEGYESLLRDFPEPQYRICVVHGQMKAEDKEFEMQRFVKGQAHIMVATTVIEVGVNVPNASVMLIEHANRFGLSQLHQLRGRVGRGAEQSYCILITDRKMTSDGKKRMATMVRSNDGFEIAEVDLEIRGPGDTQGTRQSGQIDMRIGNLLQDETIITVVRKDVLQLLEKDPMLLQPEHHNTKQYFEKVFKQQFDWSRIG